MRIKMKFILLTVVIGLILVAVSVMGYYNAQKQLTKSIEQEIAAVIGAKALEINSWLELKAKTAVTIADTMAYIDPATARSRVILGSMENDADLQDFYNGTEDGAFIKWGKAATPAGYDPRMRDWYKAAKAKNAMVFTDAYVDIATNRQVVTVAVPYKNAAGQVQGVLGLDIALDILNKQVEKIKLGDHGQGFILDTTGAVIAHADAKEIGKNIKEVSVYKEHLQEMITNNQGAFGYELNGEKILFAYAKVPSTGWIIGLELSESVVYSELGSLRMSYFFTTLFGILIMVGFSLKFALSITKPISFLTACADKIANGNLQVEKINVQSKDEISRLAEAFNIMGDNLRKLIRKVSATSEQLAASSEELTAGAAQSAEAANHVAVTITQVADGMATQMITVDAATADIESMVMEVIQVSEKTESVAEISSKTAEAAQSGGNLMTAAIDQMSSIEKAVNNSAAVVTRLGDNSKQIGQIVSVISSIAGQTNLLALNAAIEAARAGEQGKGFAVVAEEVRKLAEQSQAATEKIATLIGDIQRDTSQAVEAMYSGTSEVKSGTEAINTVGDAFQDILAMVNEITSQIQGISTSINQVSIGSQKIVMAITNVNEVSREAASQTQTISAATEEQSASMEEIASSAQSLAQVAQEMQEMISKFKL